MMMMMMILSFEDCANLPILPTGAPIAGSLVGAFEGGAPRLVGRGDASRRSRSQ